MNGELIIDAVRSVTKTWCKQRKAEKRQASRELRRRIALTHSSDSYTLKDAAYDCMEEAYRRASGNGQIRRWLVDYVLMQPAVPIQAATGEQLDDKYFTQTLLPFIV